MSPQEWAIIATIVLTITGGGIALMLNIGNDADRKRARIYERLDEVKEANKKEFVQTQLCEEKHKRTDETLNRIETKIEQIFQIIRKT